MVSATIHAMPLAERLELDQASAQATAVPETPEILRDPRLQDGLLTAIYNGHDPKLLLLWSDGSLGFAWFPQGQSVAASLSIAYRDARAALEGLHRQRIPASAAEAL